MPYYEDLSVYVYHRSMFYCPGTKNVGWLSPDHEFEKSEPSEQLLDRLWSFCKVSVAQMRGIHDCEFCSEHTFNATRNGETLLLGTSEIRVFGTDGVIYAAPTLIYHYVISHHYRPPDEFLRGLDDPAPPDPAYFDRLQVLGLEWNKTSAGGGKRFRFVRPT